MSRTRTVLQALTQAGNTSLATLSLIGANMLFNIVANASFKISAQGSNLRDFLFWQVVGNLAGLITVLTLTWLLRYIPLNVACPITTGLAVIGVQVFAARMLFHEAITPAQWLGVFLVVIGIALISGR